MKHTPSNRLSIFLGFTREATQHPAAPVMTSFRPELFAFWLELTSHPWVQNGSKVFLSTIFESNKVQKRCGDLLHALNGSRRALNLRIEPDPGQGFAIVNRAPVSVSPSALVTILKFRSIYVRQRVPTSWRARHKGLILNHHTATLSKLVQRR